MNREAFRDALVDSYENLYNIPHLQQNLLFKLFAPQSPPSLDAIHAFKQYLIDSIDLLDPGAGTPITSREWRRHRLLVMRYLDGLPPQQIADEIAISLRHYYREHKDALEVLVNVLWQRQAQVGAASSKNPTREDLVRNEAKLISQQHTHADSVSVLGAVLELLRPVYENHCIEISVDLAEDNLFVGVSTSLLRQVLIETLNTVFNAATSASYVHINGISADNQLMLCITFEPNGPNTLSQRLATVEQLCELGQITMSSNEHNQICLYLPVHQPNTVLLVDDNADFLQLTGRYLRKRGFHVVTASSGHEAIRLAKQLEPFAITLDVMIPEPDGWEVLQTLHNSRDTCHIPIIVTTVLSAQELALALGAFAFLDKPVHEAELIATLGQIASTTAP